MGSITFLAASTKSSGTNLLPILIIVVLFGVLYMTMIRPQRNRQRQAQQMQSTVVPGQRIRLTCFTRMKIAKATITNRNTALRKRP